MFFVFSFSFVFSFALCLFSLLLLLPSLPCVVRSIPPPLLPFSSLFFLIRRHAHENIFGSPHTLARFLFFFSFFFLFLRSRSQRPHTLSHTLQDPSLLHPCRYVHFLGLFFMRLQRPSRPLLFWLPFFLSAFPRRPFFSLKSAPKNPHTKVCLSLSFVVCALPLKLSQCLSLTLMKAAPLRFFSHGLSPSSKTLAAPPSQTRPCSLSFRLPSPRVLLR